MPDIHQDYWCHSGRYNSGGNSCEYIVIHYAASGTDYAETLARSLHNNSGSSSGHYSVGIDGIGQSLGDSDTAWAVGAWSGCTTYVRNNQSINIEVCNDGGPFDEREIEYLAELVPYLMEKGDIPKENVVRHYDCHSGHKMCPEYYAEYDDEWYELRERITGMALTQEDVDKIVYGILCFKNDISAKEFEGMDVYQNIWNSGHTYNKITEMYDIIVKGGEERKKEIAEVKKELRAVSESLSAVSTSVASLEQNVAKLEERVAKLEEDAY